MDLKATNKTINNFMRKIKELMQNGFTIDEAVARAYDFYPVMELMRREVKAKLKAAAERGFGDTLPDDTADILEIKPWTADGLSLSERTTRGSLAVQKAVIATINEAVRKGAAVKTLATKLFDGYSYGGIIPKQDIPEFMTELYRLSAGPNYKDADFKRLLRRVERNVSKLRTAPLKVAYNDLMAAIENRNDIALDRAIYVATQERTRYYAERIARTELARAYHDGFMAKWADDPDVKAFKWQLSSTHPVHDICDLYAKADLYGLGKGIFPKDKVPMLPAHPHCMCHLKPVFDIDISKQKEQIEQGGREFIATLSKREKEHLLGVNAAKDVEKGKVSWREKARGYSDKKVTVRLIKQEQSMHIGKNPKNGIKEFYVDRKKVNSKAYRKIYSTLPFDSSVNKAILLEALKILDEMDGTHFESIVAIDSKCGKRLGKKVGKEAFKVSFEDPIEGSSKMIILHNHPRSGGFSFTDIKSYIEESRVVGAVLVGHDGEVHVLSDIKHGIDIDELHNNAYTKVSKIAKTSKSAEKLSLLELYKQGVAKYEKRTVDSVR